MSIFNSLGSNYNLSFAIRHLFSFNNSVTTVKLKKFLENKYGGKATLVYKGREAIRLALRASELKNATVGICGFTCFAVYDAIMKEGFTPEYLDIETSDINFSYKTLEKTYKKNPEIKILIVQNTLGFPCDIDEIAKFCKEKKIILIEDLAHSIGAIYSNGKEAGSFGDFVILSFSQDKMVDGVAGGALVVRNDKLQMTNCKYSKIKLGQQWKDRLYPLFTFKIRKSYGLGIGKVLHLFLKKLNLLSKPVDNSDSLGLHSLPYWYDRSIYDEYLNLKNNLEHRLIIAKIYVDRLDKRVTSDILVKQINLSSNLRFPIFIDNRKSLIDFLRKRNIYVSDIWNDAPIAPRKYLVKTNYKIGECPNSEKISDMILNLPTHRNISEKDAKFISERINLWLESQ